jgi:perosamine synthetase
MRKPAKLSHEEWRWIQRLIPGHEPALLQCANGPRKGESYYVAEPRLVGNERAYLNECIDTNWLSSRGRFVTAFERAFARQAGCEDGVACASGTVALHLALAAVGVGRGDEVIIPAFTMIAVANAVRYTGASCKLVDVEPEHYNINPDLIEAAVTRRTKAIVAVHTYGHPADMGSMQRIARDSRLSLIEDAAEAHGAEVSNKRVGSFGLAGTFSFYSNKIVTTGEGGMVTTNDARLAELMRRLRDHAFHQQRHFWHEYVGFNYRMTNLQAAVGLAQTERIDEIIAARRRLWSWYTERLQSIRGLQLPGEARDCRSVFWMYAIRTTPCFPCTSHELREELASRGIETRSFFIPIHMQPIYIDRFRGERFPIAEELCSTGLYLPTHENLKEQDVDWICGQINNIAQDRERKYFKYSSTRTGMRRDK